LGLPQHACLSGTVMKLQANTIEALAMVLQSTAL